MRKWCQRFLLVLCSLGVSFVIAEAALRFFSAGYLGHPTDGHPILHHVQPSNLEFTSFDVASEFGGHMVVYDEDGFRVPTRGYEHDDSLKDVIFLGDSFVEASEVPYEETFVSLFATEFEEFNARNFGVSSYSPLLSYLQLRNFQDDMAPVLIVHLVYENDLRDDLEYSRLAVRDGAEIAAVPGKRNSAVHLLLRESYVARLINRARLTVKALANEYASDRQDRVSLYLDDPELGDVTQTYLRKISQFLADKDVRYLLMCVPSKLKFNEMRDHKDLCGKVMRFALDHGIEYVDLDDFFADNAKGEKPFYDRNIHLNAFGHRLTYLALSDYLKSQPLGVQ